MKYYSNCLSYRGLNHIRSNMPCQDSSGYYEGDGYTILAVADGHGDSAYFRSDDGSYLAVKSSLEYVREFIEDEGLKVHANLRPFKKEIISRWISAVRNHLKENPFTPEEKQRNQGCLDYKPYGSTLLVAVISPSYSLLIQIGDGRIASVGDDGNVDLNPHSFYETVDENSEFGMTSSLSQGHINFRAKEFDTDIPFAYALCTDGLDESMYAQDLQYCLLDSIIMSQFGDMWYNVVAPMIDERSIKYGDDVSLAVVVNSEMDVESLYKDTYLMSEAPEIIRNDDRYDFRICRNGEKNGDDEYLEEVDLVFKDGLHVRVTLNNGVPVSDMLILKPADKNPFQYPLSYSGDLSDFRPNGNGKLFIKKSSAHQYSGKDSVYRGSEKIKEYRGEFKNGHVSGKGSLYYDDGITV